MTAHFQFGQVRVFPLRRQVWLGDRRAELGDRAFDLLVLLMEQRHRVVPKDEMLRTVWPDRDVEDGNLHVQVGTLRRCIGADAIVTVHGLGYRFTATLDTLTRPADPSAPALPPSMPAHTQPAPAPEELLGRHELLQRLIAAMGQHRLLTLSGPGGAGKTRLARVLSQFNPSGWRDGVWWFDLADLNEAGQLLGAVAQGLRLPGFDSLGGADEADRLARRLKPWQALLVLDNAEHLLTAVAGLAGSLLDHAPGVQLLVTSRARLGMAAEQAFEVTGLDIPADHQLPDARRFGAIALFESRARAAGARAPFTPGELADAVAICRELDGLPLALELAAARVPLLGVKGVKAGLDDRLRAFRDPARPLPGRQRSLHDTLAWSYALLRPAEQALLRALGLMVGSFSLPDAAAVAQAPGEDRWAFVERFDSLLRLNLLSFDPLRPQHWRLPATTRLFALQQLEACQEGAAARLRHAQACVQRYGQWDQDWYDGIRPEIEIDRAAGQSLGNLCAALDWACGKGGPRVLAAQLLAVSGRVLHLFGQRVRATAWADATVAALQDGLAPEQAARLLLAWASVPPSGGRQPAQRVDFIERAMAGLSAPADRLRLTAARVRASHYAALAGDPQRAVRHLQQAQDQQDPQDPPRLRAWVLALQDRHNLYFGLGSPPPEAQLQEVLEDLEACGDGQCQFAYGIRIVLGERHLLAGLVEQARDELDLLCRSAVADGRGAASALFAPYDTLASAELACGRLPEAQAAVRLALDAAQHVQAWNQAGLVLAWLLACQGRYRAAVELVAAIDIHLQRQQQQLEQVETLARRRALTEVAKACAPGDIARWQTAGAAWTPDGLARVMAGGDPRFAP